MPRALIYTRISSDEEGRGLGVERQEQLTREALARQGITDVSVIVENDVSAMARRRPGFEEVIRRVEAGEVDVLAAYHLDRLVRRPLDLGRLTEALTVSPTPVRLITVASAEIDLDTASGRLVANLLTSVALNEVERAAERQKERHRQRAAKGWPPATPPVGYMKATTPDGEPTLEPDPQAAPAVVEMFKAFVAGATYQELGGLLTDRGVRPARAERWHINTLRNMLTSPTFIGYNEREDLGRIRGNWQPIIDETLFAQAAVEMARRTPDRRQPGTLKWPWSGWPTCGECGGRLYGTQGGGGRHLKCVELGGVQVSISERKLERFLEPFAPLAADIVRSLLEGPLDDDADDDAGDSPEEQRELLERRRSEAARMFARGELSVETFGEVVDEIERQLAALGAPTPLVDPKIEALSDALGDPGCWWREATAEQRRALVSAVLKTVVVNSSRSGKPRLVPVPWDQPGDEMFRPEVFMLETGR